MTPNELFAIVMLGLLIWGLGGLALVAIKAPPHTRLGRWLALGFLIACAALVALAAPFVAGVN